MNIQIKFLIIVTLGLFHLVGLVFSPNSYADGNYAETESNFLQTTRLRGAQLKLALQNIMRKQLDPLNYDSQMKKIFFGQVHLSIDEKGYFIEDYYCDSDYRGAQIGPNKIPNPRFMNVEHIWPQSKGSKRYPARSDMHHLLPVDAEANSIRGNLIFAEVKGEGVKRSCRSSKVGKIYDPHSSKVHKQRGFEPSDHIKGDIARAMFYVSVLYSYQIPAIEETYLLRWHQEDPVDEIESERNNRIAEVQGNRNVFIDYPHLVQWLDENDD